MSDLRNGELWTQPTFPHCRLVVQWVDADQWMLMSFPERSRHGWIASMPTTGGPAGKIILTADEAKERLSAGGYMPKGCGAETLA